MVVKERTCPIDLQSAERTRDHQCIAQPESLGSVEAERVQVAPHATHYELISHKRHRRNPSAPRRFRLPLSPGKGGGGGRDPDAVSSDCSKSALCRFRFLAFCLFLTNARFEARGTLAAKNNNKKLARIHAAGTVCSSSESNSYSSDTRRTHTLKESCGGTQANWSCRLKCRRRHRHFAVTSLTTNCSNPY